MQQSLFDTEKPQPVRKRNGHKKGMWNKKHYEEIKAFMDRNLWHVDFRLAEKYKDNPIGWAKTFFPLISDCVHREDYEGAQATKDAVIDFLNKLGADIPDSAELKLPDYKPSKVHGLICYGKGSDPSGIASDGAEFI